MVDVGYASPVGGVDLGGTAPVTFGSTASAAQVDAAVIVEWDLDNDGDFSEGVEVITGYVRELETLAGRDFPSSLTGKVGPGQLRMTLDNTDNRFSYFNASSPLTADPFSLRTGRKLRVRTSTSTPDDPVLLARDRFDGSGALTVTETGEAWTHTGSIFFRIGGAARAGSNFGTRIISRIDVGQADHYAQCSLRQVPPSNVRHAGLVIRYTDASNYTLVRFDAHETTPQVEIIDRDAGVDTVLDTYSVRAWEGMTLGAGVSGTTVTAYVGGVPVASGTTGNATGNQCGIHAEYDEFSGRAPEVADFYVWNKVPAEISGILWTGYVVDVTPSVSAGPFKVARVTGEGILANAARSRVGPPRLPHRGERTGLIVGDSMARAGLLHPPGPIQEGAATTGPIGTADVDALTMARQLEEVERGFLYETNEGYVGYDARTARDLAASQAWFTDTPGVGQYGYSEIAPVDHKGQIINEVTAGVAPDAPTGITVPFPSQTGTDNADVTLPTVTAGDLLVIFIATSQNATWLVPIWWVQHRANLGGGTAVYSHFCDGTESGTVVTFSGSGAGLWVAEIYRIENWYESYNSGVAMGEFVAGHDPAPLVHGWGRQPTLFIVAASAISSSVGAGGIDFDADQDPPDGYQFITGNSISSGSPFDTDVGLATAYKIDCTESENPTELDGLTGADTYESVVFAVRGYNGPHTKATLQDPRTTGGDGRFMTKRDLASQDEHNIIRTHQAPALFATEADADAHCTAILTDFADDRPIISISFYATKNEGLRSQAIARRVGDKITVTASGNAGLGIQADFFIEHITHRFSHGIKLWQTTWQLSPA